jgi:WhiB family redox-sensing transcriptional regulator
MDAVEWMSEARCRGARPDIFYPLEPNFAEARAVCRSCVVKVECLSYAIEKPELFGVWGGMSPQERDDLRREREAPRA